MNKIIILYTDAGSGHKSAALALKAIISQKTSWQVTLVNPFKEIAHNLDLLKKISSESCEDLYNNYVSKKETPLFSLLIISALFKLNILFYKQRLINVFAKYWHSTQPDMVISVMPFINDILGKSLKFSTTNIPFVTVITDYSECIKDIWFRSKDQLLICASQRLVEQAEAKGHPKHNIFLNSGMIVSPEFYNLKITDIKLAKLERGLQADLPTGLVMFGGYGSKAMLKIARNMNHSEYGVQLIFICGHNLQLKMDLEKLELKYPALILGFVPDTQNYMAIADFFIGKPGGLSVSEASIMKLPIIVQNNLFTLLQEKYNAHWLKEKKIGIFVRNFSKISQVVKDLLQNKQKYDNSYLTIDNRAIFEVPNVLAAIFSHNTSQYTKAV